MAALFGGQLPGFNRILPLVLSNDPSYPSKPVSYVSTRRKPLLTQFECFMYLEHNQAADHVYHLKKSSSVYILGRRRKKVTDLTIV